ncbi:expressed unknown protein [Seminavis robusta]|uniref:Uncharacterized protein n=1 Tax=Seminavis robusta TaxID=568900 RepID=A0A9N8E1I3_9STRA|nr:expressed unknown protein [Seminavis robusta]|eukprot:Sro463_g148160.1 n/a (922) ;mRNA; f:18655-21754
MFVPLAAVVLLQVLGFANSQGGCGETCPPLNYGTPVPSLCEGDLAENYTNIDRVYETCHPTVGDTFMFRDFMGAGRVTVVSNFYIGCNAGRRETGVFTHVAQRYYQQYGDRTNFVTSLKGGTNCERWAGIWQLDAITLFPDSGIVPREVPLTVLDQDSALRDDFFTAPFPHPSYVILDGDLKVRHKIVGPCCGFESFFDCVADTARGLEQTLTRYIDAILAEPVVESGMEAPPAEPMVPDPAPGDEPATADSQCTWSDWSECSVTCGDGIQFRWSTGECEGAPVVTQPCSMAPCVEDAAQCVPEFGATHEVVTVASGFDGPRDLAFHPTPGFHLGNFSEGRPFYPDEGEEAWIVNALNHSVSIVASLGSPRQTTISRRDRGYYHYMINATALAFNMVSDSGRSSDRDSFNYWAVCNDDMNTYLGLKEPNNFMGPTLYNSAPRNRNIVNRLGEECEPDEECFFLHADMLHEAPGCIGMAHDPELRTTYGNVYWLFDTTGNQENGQLVRFDFQQPHGPGSMDHSIAAVRRFPDVQLTRGDPGVHAGMIVHPVTRELFISVPGENKVIAVHADSGAYARTARQEYPIFSSRLPSFEYSIWECPEQRDFATDIDTPTGLAISPDGERLFVAERATGIIHAFEIKSGSKLFGIATGYSTIGGMEFSPTSQVLHFVDEATNTLNAVRPNSTCASPVPSRVNPSFDSMATTAQETLGRDFSLYRDYECVVDALIPDAIYFDQVHDDTGYASNDTNVQSNMTGMDASAALLADRFDCEYDSELNFDALLLGGYFCHQCLPSGGAECDPGGRCANVQWDGYTCDNEFLVVQDPSTDAVMLTYPDHSPVDMQSVMLKPGVTYRFTVKGDITACLYDSPDPAANPIESGCMTKGPLLTSIDAGSSRTFDQGVYLRADGELIMLPVEQRRLRS